jgi:beta-glucanase (GH16 family)
VSHHPRRIPLIFPAALAACSNAGAGTPVVVDAATDVPVTVDAGGRDAALVARDGSKRDSASPTATSPTDSGQPDDAAARQEGGLPDTGAHAGDASVKDAHSSDASAAPVDSGSHAEASVTCAAGSPSATTAPATVDTSCFASTFVDAFDAYDISSGPVADGMHPNERWFNGTDQCCMSPSNGWPGAMYPTASQTTGQPVNPYSLIPGGGLQISLTESNDEWFSGVMTSVDKNGSGFSQTYGYFEMSAQLAPGTGTWPAFWMLSLPIGTLHGEIDVFEQLGCSPPLNPANESIFHFTLHDWNADTTPATYEAHDLPNLTTGYHRYGLLWNATYMALYFDGALLFTTPTPSVMIGTPYFLLADMGVGSGWVTTETPNPSNLLVAYIHAYSVPSF